MKANDRYSTRTNSIVRRSLLLIAVVGLVGFDTPVHNNNVKAQTRVTIPASSDPPQPGGVRQNAVTYFRQGMNLLNQRDYDGAIKAFTKALEIDPEFAGAYIWRGVARWFNRDLESALADYGQAIKIDPNEDEAYFRRALALQQTQPERAIADYSKAIELNPTYVGAYLNRSNVRRMQGDIEGAIADLDRIIELQPQNAGAYNNQGWIQYEHGNFQAALTDFDKAIELQPNEAHGYLARGFIRAALRQFPSSYKDFDRAFQLDPNLKTVRRTDTVVVDYYVDRGMQLADSGDLDEAFFELNKAIILGGSVGPSSMSRVGPRNKSLAAALGSRGLIQLRKGNETEAQKDFTESLKLDPDIKSWLENQIRGSGLQFTLDSFVEEFALIFDEASLNFRQGKYEEAIKLYKKANRLKENKSLECLWGMAQSYDKLGAYKTVQSTCEKLIEACGDNLKYQAMAWNLIGNTLSNNAMKNPDKPDQKKLFKAEHAYREVLSASSGSQTAHYNLGVTLIRMNRISEGIEEMQACIRSAGNEEISEKARKTIEDPRRAVFNFSPDFSIVTADGEYITSDDLRGKVVLLDFWGTWCGPCRSSIPDLKRLAKKYSDKEFILVSIAVNDPQEVWREFLEDNKMDWTQVRDDKSVLQRTFQVRAFPTYILIDHDGIIRNRLIGGGSYTLNKISDEIKKALKNLENSSVAGLLRK
jgi:tetratricopeptide (TPR) repeat protein